VLSRVEGALSSIQQTVLSCGVGDFFYVSDLDSPNQMCPCIVCNIPCAGLKVAYDTYMRYGILAVDVTIVAAARAAFTALLC